MKEPPYCVCYLLHHSPYKESLNHRLDSLSFHHSLRLCFSPQEYSYRNLLRFLWCRIQSQVAGLFQCRGQALLLWLQRCFGDLAWEIQLVGCQFIVIYLPVCQLQTRQYDIIICSDILWWINSSSTTTSINLKGNVSRLLIHFSLY